MLTRGLSSYSYGVESIASELLEKILCARFIFRTGSLGKNCQVAKWNSPPKTLGDRKNSFSQNNEITLKVA